MNQSEYKIVYLMMLKKDYAAIACRRGGRYARYIETLLFNLYAESFLNRS